MSRSNLTIQIIGFTYILAHKSYISLLHAYGQDLSAVPESANLPPKKQNKVKKNKNKKKKKKQNQKSVYWQL